MMAREKQAGFGGGKTPSRGLGAGSLLAGVMIGMTIGKLAAEAMMLGTGTAIGKMMIEKTLPDCDKRLR